MSKLILHLDDEVAIRVILAASLEERGYRVVSPATLAEAIAAAEREKPDLVISDLQLDECDGLEAIDQLKTRLPGVPVILLTGVLINPQVARKTVAHQADAYLQKTAPLERILGEVRRLLGD